MIIKTRNLLHVNAPKTFLTNLEAAGTNILRWKNPSGFNASWAVQIGEAGEEQSETVILSSSTPAGTAGTLTANDSYEHPADTPLYAIKYDQVVFERSTTGTAGTATPLTNGTITYQSDSLFTQFDDTSGASTYAYRARFRNSISGTTTSQSDWLTPLGFDFYSLARIRERIKRKLWDATFITDETIIDDWINEWKDEMSNAVIALNEDYSMGTVDIAFGTAGLGTITTADFSQIRRLDITYNGQDFYFSTKQNVNDYDPNQVFSSVHPYHNWMGDTVFQVKPPESGGTARITFYRFGTIMVNDTDTLPLPMRSYTKSFVDYGLSQAYLKDEKLDHYDRSIALANIAKADFVTKLTPRDQSGPSMVDIVEAIDAQDYY